MLLREGGWMRYWNCVKKKGWHIFDDILLEGVSIPRKLSGLLSNFWATESLGQSTVCAIWPWCIFYLFHTSAYVIINIQDIHNTIFVVIQYDFISWFLGVTSTSWWITFECIFINGLLGSKYPLILNFSFAVHLLFAWWPLQLCQNCLFRLWSFQISFLIA